MLVKEKEKMEKGSGWATPNLTLFLFFGFGSE